MTEKVVENDGRILFSVGDQVSGRLKGHCHQIFDSVALEQGAVVGTDVDHEIARVEADKVFDTLSN